MLTGRCKQDFETWALKKYGNYYIIGNDTLVIEWLDSINIYVSIEAAFDNMCKYVRGFYVNVITDAVYEIWFDGDVFETRQEATKSAIEKANELYNEKFK